MFYDEYCYWCSTVDKTPNRVANEVGLSESAPSTWKIRDLTPRFETQKKLADYFKISLDELNDHTKSLHKVESDDLSDDITNDLYKTLSDLCEKKCVSGGRMCEDLGMSRAFMTELKNGRAKSITLKTAHKLANYFDVPIETFIETETNSMYQRLLELAERRGMSANQMRIAAGLSPGFLSDLKSVRCNNFSRKTAEKLADVLGITVDEIYEDKITEVEEIEEIKEAHDVKDELLEKRKLIYDLSQNISEDKLNLLIKIMSVFIE